MTTKKNFVAKIFHITVNQCVKVGWSVLYIRVSLVDVAMISKDRGCTFRSVSRASFVGEEVVGTHSWYTFILPWVRWCVEYLVWMVVGVGNQLLPWWAVLCKWLLAFSLSPSCLSCTLSLCSVLLCWWLKNTCPKVIWGLFPHHCCFNAHPSFSVTHLYFVFAQKKRFCTKQNSAK